MLSIEASTDVFLRKNLPDGDSYLVGLEFRCGDAWDVTLMVLNSTGDPLAQVSKPVRTADCSHVVFTFPNGGLALSLAAATCSDGSTPRMATRRERPHSTANSCCLNTTAISWFRTYSYD